MSPPQVTKMGAIAVNPVGLQPVPKSSNFSVLTSNLPAESTVLLFLLGAWRWEENSECMSSRC